MESVEADMQHTAGVKHTTDSEGGSTAKKGALMTKTTPENKAEIRKYAAGNGIAGRLK